MIIGSFFVQAVNLFTISHPSVMSLQMVPRKDIGPAGCPQTQAHGRRPVPGSRVRSAPRRLRAVPLLQTERVSLPRHLSRQQADH